MSCEQSRAAIQEMIDGTLGPIRLAELRQHLDACLACRTFAEDLSRLRDVTATLEPIESPDHLWLQIAGRLRQEGRVHDRPTVQHATKLPYAWLATAAALLITVGASLLWMIPRVGPRSGA